MGSDSFFNNGGSILKEINHTFITPMPKSKFATTLGDFRLIARCNVLYKIVSKILNNKLQEVVGSLVLRNQTAIVKGSLIRDSILLSHELVRGFSNRIGSARVTLKIDLKKAYDIVRRDFLWEVLEGMGFSCRWVSWMKQCIGSHFCLSW